MFSPLNLAGYISSWGDLPFREAFHVPVSLTESGFSRTPKSFPPSRIFEVDVDSDPPSFFLFLFALFFPDSKMEGSINEVKGALVIFLALSLYTLLVPNSGATVLLFPIPRSLNPVCRQKNSFDSPFPFSTLFGNLCDVLFLFSRPFQGLD